ncbi:twin-arginine translocase subunit TatC [Virgibacillus ainsalahensis]
MADEHIHEEDKEMNLTGHLSELRNRLIVTAIFFIIFFGVGFIYVEYIIEFFTKDLDTTLTLISPGEIIWVNFSMAGLVAIVATLPLLTVQVWLFIKPGLTPNERKASLAYIPFIFLLFIGGLVFGYVMFVKLIFPFLLNLNAGMFTEMFTVERYFKFLLRITVPFAVIFEIPIIAMFLTSLGVLTPDFMRKSRKYAYFILIIVGTMVTPPDLIMPIIIAIPLVLLYEISIYLSATVYRKKQKKHEEFMNNDSLT